MNDSEKLVHDASKVLDFTAPVAVFLMGVLGHIADLSQAHALVWRLMERVPSGSHFGGVAREA
nr:SAM-dependent methyltransferase [Pseudonocardia humida]